MARLTDNAAKDLVLILEYADFKIINERPDAIILGNPEICDHALCVRTNSPLTDDLAQRIMRSAKISEERILVFLEKYLVLPEVPGAETVSDTLGVDD